MNKTLTHDIEIPKGYRTTFVTKTKSGWSDIGDLGIYQVTNFRLVLVKDKRVKP